MSLTVKFAANLNATLANARANRGAGRPWPYEPKPSVFNTAITAVTINDKGEYRFWTPSPTPGGKSVENKIPGLSVRISYRTYMPDGQEMIWDGEQINVPFSFDKIPTQKFKGRSGKEYSIRESAVRDFERLFGVLEGLLDNTTEVSFSNLPTALLQVQQMFDRYAADNVEPEYSVSTKYRKRSDKDGNEQIDKHDYINSAVVAGAADPENTEEPAPEEEPPADEELPAEEEAPVEEEAPAEEPEPEPEPAPRRAAPPAARRPAPAPAKKPAPKPAARRR